MFHSVPFISPIVFCAQISSLSTVTPKPRGGGSGAGISFDLPIRSFIPTAGHPSAAWWRGRRPRRVATRHEPGPRFRNATAPPPAHIDPYACDALRDALEQPAWRCAPRSLCGVVPNNPMTTRVSSPPPLPPPPLPRRGRCAEQY
jgi:hypothetical protein